MLSAPANAKNARTEATAASPESDQRFRAAFNNMRLAGEMIDVVITVASEDSQASLESGQRPRYCSLVHTKERDSDTTLFAIFNF